MKKLFIIALAALTLIIALSSCSFEACPTYSSSSLKQYGPKYTYAKAQPAAVKKQKKNKIW